MANGPTRNSLRAPLAVFRWSPVVTGQFSMASAGSPAPTTVTWPSTLEIRPTRPGISSANAGKVQASNAARTAEVRVLRLMAALLSV